jgi:preprotein translocase subunit SecA
MDYLKDGIGLRAMAQRDPLVEYQREGFAMYQTMMQQIREEAIGFLFNLEVEVTGGGANAAVPTVAARGLSGSAAPAQGLSYSAPSSDVSGGVEVRDQRGQLERAATAKAQQAQEQQAASVNPAFGRPAQPQQGQPQAKPTGERGAFGQRQGGPAAPPPVNRAQRRAQEKNKKR